MKQKEPLVGVISLNFLRASLGKYYTSFRSGCRLRGEEKNYFFHFMIMIRFQKCLISISDVIKLGVNSER